MADTDEMPILGTRIPHPRWCDPGACYSYQNEGAMQLTVLHANVLYGQDDCCVDLLQNDLIDLATGRHARHGHARVLVTCHGWEELNVPAEQAAGFAHEHPDPVGAALRRAAALLPRADRDVSSAPILGS